jgi:hypothetical protein
MGPLFIEKCPDADESSGSSKRIRVLDAEGARRVKTA